MTVVFTTMVKNISLFKLPIQSIYAGHYTEIGKDDIEWLLNQYNASHKPSLYRPRATGNSLVHSPMDLLT